MKKIYKLEDLDCANCAAKMENAIARLDGVKSVTVSFLTQKMTIETEGDDQSELMKQMVKLCKKVEPDCVIHV